MRAHIMRNSNQILHGDQTILEENFTAAAATFLADASVASHHYQNEVLTETAYRHYEYMYYELPFRRK